MRKSIDTITVLSMPIWEPFVASSETIAPSVELKDFLFHYANSPRGHRHLHVESDGNSGPAGGKREEEK